MNQVTEMLRVIAVEKQDTAIERLQTLFQMMTEAPGFLQAELLVSTRDPLLLLVLHSWQSITDWQDFRASDAKISFSATRPGTLYSFVPCGTNWRFRWGPPAGGTGDYLRRQVVRGEQAPSHAIPGARVFAYQDYEPEYVDSTMRLIRTDAPPADLDSPEVPLEVIADEVFRSLHQVSVQSGSSAVAGRYAH